jgi:UPF0176 protein
VSHITTFYKFAAIAADALEPLRERLEAEAAARDLKGTILLAQEGMNGTMSGAEAPLRAFAEVLRAVPGFADMPFKYSVASEGNKVFYRLKVRIKPEIVALGQPGVKPGERTGTHVDAMTWNALLDDPNLIVIDTRNDYEIGIGTFPGAVDPHTRSFKQFPDYVATLDPEVQPKVAMFCTGGIRCEKASAYMLDQGFEEVYQLDGGILKYLETVAPNDNRWQGECFVFDQRVSVDRWLGEGSYEQCFACRRPLTREDLESDDYRQGVSCPRCVDEQDEAQRAAFAERQRQVELAEARGDQHVGKRMPIRPERARNAAGQDSSSGTR